MLVRATSIVEYCEGKLIIVFDKTLKLKSIIPTKTNTIFFMFFLYGN
jgi:hypothetical protein